MDRKEFDGFLPGSEHFDQLAALVRLYVKDPLDFDIELHLNAEQRPPRLSPEAASASDRPYSSPTDTRGASPFPSGRHRQPHPPRPARHGEKRFMQIDLGSLMRKLDPTLRQHAQCGGGPMPTAGRYEITVEHWLSSCSRTPADVVPILRHFEISQAVFQRMLQKNLDIMRTGNSDRRASAT